MPSSCGDDEKIGMKLPSAIAANNARARNDLARFGEQNLGVLLRVQQPGEGRRVGGGRERRCGDLLQQRLEDVVIRAVNDGDVHCSIAQSPRRV